MKKSALCQTEYWCLNPVQAKIAKEENKLIVFPKEPAVYNWIKEHAGDVGLANGTLASLFRRTLFLHLSQKSILFRPFSLYWSSSGDFKKHIKLNRSLIICFHRGIPFVKLKKNPSMLRVLNSYCSQTTYKKV